MTATWAWARRELHRRRRSTIALVLLLGISGAVALTAAAGARRTGTAFERFLQDANTADAQLQYTSTDPMLDERVLQALRDDPDIEAASSLFLVLAFAVDRETTLDFGIYAGSEPDIFEDIDGLRILEGSRADPAEPHEVTINRFTQEALGVEVGDTVPVGTFSAAQLETGEPEGEPEGPVIELEVVGIHVSPYDLADPTFAGFFGTQGFHEDYWGVAGGYGPIVEVATRDGVDPAAVVEDAVADFELEEGFVTPVSQQTDRVSDGTRVLAVGLMAFAAAAALAAVVASAQALHRRIGDSAPDLPTLRAIGLTRGQSTAALLLPLVPAIVAGVALAVVLSVVASPLMPVGIARQAEPHRGVDVDAWMLGMGCLAMIAVLTVTSCFSAARVARLAQLTATPATTAGEGSARGRRLRAPLSPPAQLGVSMALDPGQGRRATPVRSAMVGAAFGVAGIVATLTFGAGLDFLVKEPSASGWSWTFAPDTTDEQVQAIVDAPDTADVGTLEFSQVTAEDTNLTAVSVRADKGTPSLTVVDGRMPAGPREVALGPKTAEAFGVGIGDAVTVGDPSDRPEELVVVGEVLFPTFDENPFNEGLALSPDTHAALADSDGFPRTVVTFEDGVSDDEAARRMEEIAPGSMSIYAYPSPPPDIANLEAVRFLPRALGAFLSVLALAAVGHALATSARRRRHDLGIVRSLGFVGRDVHRAVDTQSMTLVMAGLIIGIPVGVAIGRVAWKVVADGIGVAAEGATAGPILLVVTAGALAASLLLAVLPGRSAASRHAVDALRVE